MSIVRRLVFVGDSLTDAGRDRDDDASLGDGHVRRIADALARRGEDVVVLNRGIAGNRAADLEARWAAEVEALRPDVLTIHVGVNDMWRRFDACDPTSAQQFEASYRRLIARTGRAEVILMEPHFVPVRDEQRAWLEDLDEKRAVVRHLAAETGATFVPLQDVMTEAVRRSGAAAVLPDGVHPMPAAAELIAAAWLAVYDARPITADDSR